MARMSRGEKLVLAGIAAVGIAFMVLVLWLAIISQRDGEARCATIGARWHGGGRGTSFCVKPDGSMWGVP
jgi:hypothetical protein